MAMAIPAHYIYIYIYIYKQSETAERCMLSASDALKDLSTCRMIF